MARQQKKPAAAAASKQRVRRVGFKDYKALAKAMAPFIKTKYFTTYTSQRDMKQLDRKKLQSRPFGYRIGATVSYYCILGPNFDPLEHGCILQSRFFQGVFTATMSLSRTWNFPDTTIKKSLLHLLKFQDPEILWGLRS